MALWGNKDTFAITGTIGVPNASKTVTGVSTLFTTELKAGQTILIASVKYKIASITDINHLELVIPYVGTASGATITRSTIPTYVPQADLQYMYFVDETEAQLASNHNRGINGGGWWKIVEYVDSDGSTRFKTECLVAMGTPAATSGDAADNTIAASVANTITINTQPTGQTTILGAATFTAGAIVTNAGTVTYQWQKALAASPMKFTNVTVNGTSASLVLAGQLAANTGDKYRVVVASNNGADRKTSTAVALTFGTGA